MAKTCLIVDDSDSVRAVIRRIVEMFGLDAREAANGSDALARCRERMPDGILLDWRMPGMDGFDFLVRLRAEEGGERPAVVFCTTQSDVSNIEAALSAGADDYIIKPFDIDILRSKLSAVGVLAA